MEILQTFICSFPNWCRQCSRIVVDKAINITTVAWMNCTETRDYRMTVNNSRGSVLHETDVSCCKGSITIKYMKGNFCVLSCDPRKMQNLSVIYVFTAKGHLKLCV